MGEISSLAAAASKALKVGTMLAVMWTSGGPEAAQTVSTAARVIQAVQSTASNYESGADVLHQLDPSFPDPGDPPWGGGPTGRDFSTLLDEAGERQKRMLEQAEQELSALEKSSSAAALEDGHLLRVQSMVGEWQTALVDSRSFTTSSGLGSSVSVTRLQEAAEPIEDDVADTEEEEIDDEEDEDAEEGDEDVDEGDEDVDEDPG
jgi:hypothetical protein